MNNIWNATYIVTDVETTGSNSSNDRITEIACVTVKNGEIVSQYSTLVNPHKEIPPYVAKMTGITQMMVSRAPEEHEVIDTLSKIFKGENAVFVAHNVIFDYGFISNFFKRGYKHFDMVQLCSLKLARKLLPRDVKKNVGDMSEYFGIRLKNRHRALIDAKATAMSLIEMLHLAENEHKISTLNDLLVFQNKPVYNYKVSVDTTKRLNIKFDDIPYQPGIFKFYDIKGNLIFWDYSFNLNLKLQSFFNNYHITSKHILEITQKIDSIHFQTTESELSALILRNKIMDEMKELELFAEPKENILQNINIPVDFIYIQPQDNGEKIIDVYLINNGKLIYQNSVGLKAPIDTIAKKIKDIYYDTNLNNKIEFQELKVINKWIDMQNESGMLINLQGLNFQNLIITLKQSMLKVYDMNYSNDNKYYFD
jgi:DNA polymerase III epsilon subunit family exonuclease